MAYSGTVVIDEVTCPTQGCTGTTFTALGMQGVNFYFHCTTCNAVFVMQP